MASKNKYFGGKPPWKSLPFAGASGPDWLPMDDSDRASAYDTYETIYWSEDGCFTVRTLVTEQTLYMPNGRVIVDTIAHYLLKGLCVSLLDPETYKTEAQDLDDFLKREMFYPRFHTAKHGGVMRGDFALHMTADPNRPDGKRICLNSVHPGKIVREFDDDDGDRVTQVWICESYTDPNDPDKPLIRRLHYWYQGGENNYDDAPPEYADRSVMDSDSRRVMSEEMIMEVDADLWDEDEHVYQVMNPAAPLPPEIDTIPVYWFKNIPTDGQPYGSSEMRGVERVIRQLAQEGSDLGVAMALDGLGIYVTDATRPKNDSGQEIPWSVEPGQVAEIQNGTYFKRVNGVTSVAPMVEAMNWFKASMMEATGVTGVSLGDVDGTTASNPMALSIKFLPTLAKITERDAFGIGRLNNLFTDWTKWREAYENEAWPDGCELSIKIGEKLPEDRTERINELNNMLDRNIISRKFYRSEMENLGYKFPDDIEDQVKEEREEDLELNTPENQEPNVPVETALAAVMAGQAGAGQGDPASLPQGVNGQKSTTLPPKGNQSNNKSKTNESDGTEATQPLAKQTTAKGVRPKAGAKS